MDLSSYLKKHMERKGVTVTKLPSEEPKSAKNASIAYDESKHPVNLWLTDKQAPFVAQLSGGEKHFIIMQVQVNSVTTTERQEKGKTEKGTEARLTILEVAKL